MNWAALITAIGGAVGAVTALIWAVRGKSTATAAQASAIQAHARLDAIAPLAVHDPTDKP